MARGLVPRAIFAPQIGTIFMFRLLLWAFALWFTNSAIVSAQKLQAILQTHAEEVLRPGRRSVDVVLDDLVASGLPQALPFLEAWRDREIVQRTSDGLFFKALETEGSITLTDLDAGSVIGAAAATDVTEARPNGGVRRAIGEALVQFQLSDPDILKRRSAVEVIARSTDA